MSFIPEIEYKTVRNYIKASGLETDGTEVELARNVFQNPELMSSDYETVDGITGGEPVSGRGLHVLEGDIALLEVDHKFTYVVQGNGKLYVLGSLIESDQQKGYSDEFIAYVKQENDLYSSYELIQIDPTRGILDETTIVFGAGYYYGVAIFKGEYYLPWDGQLTYEDPDLYSKFDGVPHQSDTVLLGKTLPDFTGVNCHVVASKYGGANAMRLIASNLDTKSYATYSFPDEDLPEVTLMGTYNLPKRLDNTITDKVLEITEPDIFVNRESDLRSSNVYRVYANEERNPIEVESENLFTNPNLVGDGTWAEVARFTTGTPAPVMVQPEDFRIRDLGSGESVIEIENVRGLNTWQCIAGVSTWEGKPAVRLIRVGSEGESFVSVSPGISGFTAMGTVHLKEPMLAPFSDLTAIQEGDSPWNAVSASTPNEAGSYSLRGLVSESTSTVRFTHGGAPGSGDVWWTEIGLFSGDYDGFWYSGSSDIPGKRTSWSGPVDDSTSLMSKAAELIFHHGGVSGSTDVYWTNVGIYEGKYTGPSISGGTKPFVYEGYTVYPQWTGQKNNSYSEFTYQVPLPPIQGQIQFGKQTGRNYEIGVDRAVLFVKGKPAVAWNGIVSIEDASEKSEIVNAYYDGFKYLNVVPRSEYAAKIEAYYSPKEFDECDGTLEAHIGLFVTHMEPQPFDLVYRTMINEKDYKLHLVYNALASPAARSAKSITDTVTPETLSWDVTTSPNYGERTFNQAHYYLDTINTPSMVIYAIEHAIYGGGESPPTLPSIAEVIEILDTIGNLTVIDNGDGTWTASAPDHILHYIDDTTFQLTWPTAIMVGTDIYTITT